MQVISFSFLIFLPVVVLVYAVLPQKMRGIWLLAASWFFYLSAGAIYGIFLAVSIVTTYVAALLMEKPVQQTGTGRRKLILVSCLVLNLGILGVFKYAGFACHTVTGLLTALRIGSFATQPALHLILPVGISFYLFQALGYLIDVYRGEIRAQHSFLRYALFVSFFPTVLSGPIERAGHMLPQLAAPQGFHYENMRKGLLRMLWGYFLKMVLADRIAILVDTVYASPAGYPGTVLFIAAVLYTFQIYCDFGGYTNIAVGAAQICGFELMENFDTPYLSGSIAEFWRRWHRSLSFWFRDYLYFPLGGNRKGTVRKYINIMIVFMVSGLWHGAAWTFVIWGGLHGLYQVIGHLLMPLRNAVVKRFRIDRESFSHRLFKVLFTFLLVTLAWVFFRAERMTQALTILAGMRHITPSVLTDGTLYQLGLDRPNFLLMIFGLLILIGTDLCNHRGIKVSEKILSQGLWLRWCIYIAAVVIIAVCGIWGPGYDATSFIYYKF